MGLVVETAGPVPWTKPTNLVYDPDGPLPPLGGLFSRPVHFLGYEVARKPGLNACFADGSVRFLDSSTGKATLRGFITRNGGEKVD
jgi:prepilin-type processing-associated H-X9-DG protein